MYKLLTNILARQVQAPPYLILFVSDHCWMRCSHCWYSEDWKNSHLGRPPLGFEALERLAASIPRLWFLSLTGGEAFLRDDIVEIGTMFARRTRLHRYQIPTSGFVPDVVLRQTERLLLANRGIPFRVDVSLDGTEQTHEAIRHAPGGFAAALDTLAALNRLARRHSWLDVGVITTLCRQNQDEVAAIARLVERIHPDGEWMVNIARGASRDPSAVSVDVQRYREAHEHIERRMRTGSYRGHAGHVTAGWLCAKNATRRKVIQAIIEGREPGGGCAAGALGGVVYSDGEVAACEMLDRSFGNLHDWNYDLPKLWKSAAAVQARDWIQDTRCQCTQECFLSVSLLLQPRHWPALCRERLRVWRARRRARVARTPARRRTFTSPSATERTNEVES